jgi:protein-S-isoprenylcysteine O-methyltransferase Ste14
MPEYWPGICIGILVGSYWARVLKLVRKTRKTTGHGANFLPPEPLGRVLRIIWIPVIIAWIALPFMTAWRPAALLWDVLPLSWLAVAIAVIAFGATLVCWKRMGKSWRMGIDPNETTQLIVSGPYAYVRHPIYALQCVLLVASFLAVQTVAMLVVACVGIALLQWEARREERYLVEKHGVEYEDYLRRVGRFIPRSVGGYHASLQRNVT